MKMNSFNFFKLSWKGRLYTCLRVIRLSIPEVTYGVFDPGGEEKAPSERGTFLRLQVYKRVEISLAEVYESVGMRHFGQ